MYDWHVSSGARMIDFGGWEMPLQYTGIANEHISVRRSAGIFDVSHMGDIVIRGEGAGLLIGRLITNDPAGMEVGKGIYGHILNDDGKIIDDTIVYRIAEDGYLMVPNASMTGTVLRWIQGKRTGQEVLDVTEEIACFAVQGPEATALMQRLTGLDLSTIKRFHFVMTSLEIDGQPGDIVTGLRPSPLSDGEVGKDPDTAGVWPGGPLGSRVMLSRTGYTGEDGFEVLCDSRVAMAVWNLIISVGGRSGLVPAGLGARDSLRLEMGYLLSGTDFDGSQSTVQTGPAWAVKWEHEFIGREALRQRCWHVPSAPGCAGPRRPRHSQARIRPAEGRQGNRPYHQRDAVSLSEERNCSRLRIAGAYHARHRPYCRHKRYAGARTCGNSAVRKEVSIWQKASLRHLSI